MSVSSTSVCDDDDDQDNLEKFFDAADGFDITGEMDLPQKESPFRPDTSTLKANDEFSTCRGDTLKSLADQNFALNSQAVQIYDDMSLNDKNSDIVDDSLSSGNRDQDDYEHYRSNDSLNDADFSPVSQNVQLPHIGYSTVSDNEPEIAPRISLTRSTETDSDGRTDNSTSSGAKLHVYEKKWKRKEHLSLDNLNSGLTSDSGTSFTPSSDFPEYLSVPKSEKKTSSMPPAHRAHSPCEFYKTLDRNYAPTEDSASDYSESTNTTQETRSSRMFGIRETPRKLLTKFKKTRSKKEPRAKNENALVTSGTDTDTKPSAVNAEDFHSSLYQHIPSYASDNYPEDREQNFSKSTTIVQTIESHQHNLAIWCLKFSNCGKYLAAAGQDKAIRVWVLRCEFENLNLVSASSTRASVANPGTMSYASQKSLEGSLKSNSLKSEDSNTDTSFHTSPFLPEPYRTFSKHSSDVMDIAWSTQNSSYLISASMDKNVRLWHIHMNKCLGAFDHQNIVTCVSFPPKDLKVNIFLSGAMDGKVRIWSITEKKVLSFYEATGGKKQPITSMCYNNNGDYILIGTLNGQVLKLDAVQLRLLSETRILNSKGKLRRSNIKIVSIQESPRNPETFLISSSDCRIRLYEASNVSSHGFLANSDKVAGQISNAGALFLRQKAKYKGHSNKNSPIRTGFSRLGNFIISGSECKGIFIWHTEPLDGKSKNTIFECIQSHEVSVTAATFSPTVEAIDCLDRCQRRVQEQQLKALAAQNAASKSLSTQTVTNIHRDRSCSPVQKKSATLQYEVSEGRLSSRGASKESELFDSGFHHVSADETATCGASLPVTSNFHDDLNMGPISMTLHSSIGIVDSNEWAAVKGRSGVSSRFTVGDLKVGEVFASADYTGKINIYFA